MSNKPRRVNKSKNHSHVKTGLDLIKRVAQEMGVPVSRKAGVPRGEEPAAAPAKAA